jgi:hypothetical protein
MNALTALVLPDADDVRQRQVILKQLEEAMKAADTRRYEIMALQQAVRVSGY